MSSPGAPADSAAGPALLAPLRWWDLDEVQVLEADLFGAEGWSPAQFWAELARVPQSRWYVVARREGRVVGYAGLYLLPPEADVQTIAVARAAQGLGIGRLLLSALGEQATRTGAHVLHLEVRADNDRARALYERAGFVLDGRRRDYYGRGRDALLMSCRVAPTGEVRRG